MNNFVWRQAKIAIPDGFGNKEIVGALVFCDADNYNNIKTIICGCCGCVFEPEEVTIIKIFNNWIDLTEEIIGND